MQPLCSHHLRICCVLLAALAARCSMPAPSTGQGSGPVTAGTTTVAQGVGVSAPTGTAGLPAAASPQGNTTFRSSTGTVQSDGASGAGGAPTTNSTANPVATPAMTGNTASVTSTVATAPADHNDVVSAPAVAQPAAKPRAIDWNNLRYAFFGYLRQSGGSDVGDALQLFVSDNANFCATSANATLATMGTLEEGERSLYVYLPASLKGYTVGTWLGVSDYGPINLGTDIHLRRTYTPALSPNTCTLSGGGESYAANFSVQSVSETSLQFRLVGAATASEPNGVPPGALLAPIPATIALTAQYCDFYRPLWEATLAAARASGAESFGYGPDNVAPCRLRP